MAQGKKVTKKQWNKFLETLKEMIGLVETTCNESKISRWVYYHHRLEDPKFAKQADQIMNRIGRPFTEDKLREAIFCGEGWAIRFYLQCKSKQWRPYEKREISGTLKTEVEQKIRTDPALKKAVQFYEEAIKKEYRKRDHCRKSISVDQEGKNQKRKRRAH